MDLFERIESCRFVGEEFLTWLWYRSERDEGHFDIEGGGTLELHFDNQLTLEANLAEAERTKLTGGAPSFSPEAKEALRRGKRVAQAKVRIIRDAREWIMTITGRSLALSGLKIPAVLSREEDDQFYERMELLDEADAAVRALYASFIAVRIDADAWATELAAMREWVAADA
jgi:recombination associated protein RdgC